MTESDRNPVLRCLHHWPTRILCIMVTLLQAATLNWYLMDHLSYKWAAVYAADGVVISLFIASFLMAKNVIYKEKRLKHPLYSDSGHQPLTYIAWFVYATVLDLKVCFIFATISARLDENYFFGPNTCKTAIGMAGLVFITFLHSQHDVRDSHRKALILILTTRILVDMFDGAEFMDTLFIKEVRDKFPPYLDVVMIAVCCINLMLPAIPLITLAVTRFGLNPLAEKPLLLHKIALAYLVNLPLFTTRMVQWHGFNHGISIFTLKNLVVMAVITFEVLEKWYLEVDNNSKPSCNTDLTKLDNEQTDESKL